MNDWDMICDNIFYLPEDYKRKVIRNIIESQNHEVIDKLIKSLFDHNYPYEIAVFMEIMNEYCSGKRDDAESDLL